MRRLAVSGLALAGLFAACSERPSSLAPEDSPEPGARTSAAQVGSAIRAGTLVVCTDINGNVYSGPPNRDTGDISIGDEWLFLEVFHIEAFLSRSATPDDVRLGTSFMMGTPAESFQSLDIDGDGSRDIRVRWSIEQLVRDGNLSVETREIQVWGRDQITGSLFCHTSPATVSGIVYTTSFERPTFEPGPLVGQDGWFAGLGAEAAGVWPGPPFPPDGQQFVAIDGSRLEEFFGFFFGSYARALNYMPIRRDTPLVTLSGYTKLWGEVPPTCGAGLGITGTLDGEYITNIQIGVREQNGVFVSYLSNYDGVFVNGPAYTLGRWIHVRAVFDFEQRTVRGFFNGEPMGEIPFTRGIENDVAFVNIFLGSNRPLPNVVAFVDSLSVIAGAERR